MYPWYAVPTIRQQVFDALKQAELEFGGVIAALTIGERSLLSHQLKDVYKRLGLPIALRYPGCTSVWWLGRCFCLFRFVFGIYRRARFPRTL